jgi:hypothetical protein
MHARAQRHTIRAGASSLLAQSLLMPALAALCKRVCASRTYRTYAQAAAAGAGAVSETQSLDATSQLCIICVPLHPNALITEHEHTSARARTHSSFCQCFFSHHHKTRTSSSSCACMRASATHHQWGRVLHVAAAALRRSKCSRFIVPRRYV